MKKNNVTKIMCVGLTALMATTSFAACGGGGETSSGLTEAQKANMTELVVGVYNGGLGTTWVDELASKFQTMYAGVEFEPGKKGVYITSVPKKREYDQVDSFINNIKAGAEIADVYINTGDNFEKYVENNVALDMTALINEDVYDANGEISANGTTSIADRLLPYFMTADNFGTTDNPKYYHLPYEWGIHGFIYDRDLLTEPYAEGSQESLLTKADGSYKYTGYEGTPKTTTEFKTLLQEISDKGYYGYTFSKNDAGFYWHDYQYGFLAQYEGEDEAMLNLTYDGVATFAANTFDAATCSEEGITTDPTTGIQSVTITDENAWLLASQTGKTEYVKFIRDILNSSYYDPNVVGLTQTFDIAQGSFVTSIMSGKTRIAMLFDGEWWENEARNSFTTLGKMNANWAYGKRDFRFMPIPQAEGGENEKYSFFINGAGPCFINKNTKKADLAKKWVQFMYSNTGCNVILKNTGMTLPMDFTIDAETESQITPFALSTYKLKTSPDVKIYMANATQPDVNPFAVNSTLNMTGYAQQMLSNVPVSAGSTQTGINQNVVKYLVENSPITATTWNNGMKSMYSKEKWQESYNAYFNK